jgi:hypothetical protein
MVMSICAGIIPTPSEGYRISMLRALKEVVGEAYTKCRKGSSEFGFGNWWIREFVALGRSKVNAIKDETSRGTAATIPTTGFTFDVAAGQLSDVWLEGILGEYVDRSLGERFSSFPYMSQGGISMMLARVVQLREASMPSMS